MRAVAEFLRYANVLILAVLAAACARRWRAGGPGAGWVTLAFAALAVLFASRIVRAELAEADGALVKLTAGLAVLFPYLLFRFGAALAPASRRTEILVGGLTGAVLVATAALPGLPIREDPRPAWLSAFIAALLVQWAVVLSVVVRRLWRAGGVQASLARRRMRSLGFAAAALVLAVVVAGLGPGARPPAVDLAFRLLILGSALAFFVAFAPPTIVRTLWRHREEEQVRRATQALMGATAPEEVITAVLPPMAAIVGARAVALLDGEGRLLGSHGIPPDERARLEAGRDAAPALAEDLHALRVPLRRGSVIVWTSPYAPVFGEEELELLRTLGALAELALERARLFAHEREARRVVEEADELKSGFIALASHELRAPATTVYGLAELFEMRATSWTEERQAEFRRHLREEAGRLVQLIEQLLDLSRLEAGAIEISPRRLPIRERVEEIVRHVARERAPEIAIDVAPGLEANVDPTALDRVVSNLVGNALKYGETPVTIAAVERDRHFRLVVEDRGPGVPPDFVPRLFERFARAEQARGRPGGAGLGLAIAQSYAQAHGGQLVYQDAQPHGARFELVLPRSGRGAPAHR